MLILKNCRLVKELSENIDLDFADILIQDNIIKSIKPVGSKFNIEATEIDIKNNTVLPGFIELHTHLCLDNGDYIRSNMYSTSKTLLTSYAFAKEYLKSGYTTVRDAGCRNNVTCEIAEAINEGILVGPRIISCGQILSPTETGNEEFGNMYYEADGKYELQKAARLQYKLGNDFSKVMVTGSFLNKSGDPGMQVITLPELKAIVEVAKLKNSYVAAHCHSDNGIRCALQAGVRTIEHACFIEEDTIELIKHTKDVFIVPTAAIGMECLSEDNSSVTSDAYEKGKKYEKIEKNALNNCYKAGLTLGFGSDIDMEAFVNNPGYEFIARKEFYSFDDIDILKQATINNAKILKMDDSIGSIKEGKIADLVIINGNPDEDIYVLKENPIMVIKEGVII